MSERRFWLWVVNPQISDVAGARVSRSEPHREGGDPPQASTNPLHIGSDVTEARRGGDTAFP